MTGDGPPLCGRADSAIAASANIKNTKRVKLSIILFSDPMGAVFDRFQSGLR